MIIKYLIPLLFALFAPLIVAAPIQAAIDGSLDSMVEMGEHHDLALRNSLSVVAYNELDRNGDNILTNRFNLAYCLSDCAANPIYRHYAVADGVVSLGGKVKLVLNGLGNPVLAFYEGISFGTLTLAKCIRDCYTVAPTYLTMKTDVSLSAKSDFDIALVDSRPIIVYGSNALSLAVCIEKCNTPTPILFKRTISGNLGAVNKIVLKIINGNPVIAYERVIDWGYTKLGFIGLIYCTQDCYSTAGQYQTYAIANGTINTKTLFDMAVDKQGRPVFAYAFDDAGLNVAKCQENCFSFTPSYQHASVDRYGSNPSLTLRAGSYPSMVYYNTFQSAQNLKYAFCVKDCDTATPVYGKRLLDSPYQGWESADFEISNGQPVITLYDSFNKDLKAIHCDKPGCPP